MRIEAPQRGAAVRLPEMVRRIESRIVGTVPPAARWKRAGTQQEKTIFRTRTHEQASQTTTAAAAATHAGTHQRDAASPGSRRKVVSRFRQAKGQESGDHRRRQRYR